MTIEHKGGTAVRAAKRPRLSDGQIWQDLELFPTPPWATRALMDVLGLKPDGKNGTAWEPCRGLGHMSDVLEERFDVVIESDVHDYDAGDGFIGEICDATDAEQVCKLMQDFGHHGCNAWEHGPNWIITNPPFGKAEDMVRLFLDHAQDGVALLLRTQFLEGQKRYDLFAQFPPTLVAVFAGRVAMCEGGYDPKGSTATSYAWFIWRKDGKGDLIPPRSRNTNNNVVQLDIELIPPGAKKFHSHSRDALLAARHVPGFVPPSTLKKTGKTQASMDLAAQ